MKFLGNNPSTPPPATNKTSANSVDTLIGRHTEILGDIRFAGGLHLDGRIKGKVLASTDKAASLSVTESGMVEGDVRVPNVMLNGTVVGDVYASEKITLAAKARVTGNVFYKILEMQAGAQVNGQLVHEKSEMMAALVQQAGGPHALENSESDGRHETLVIDVRDARMKKAG
ncbi:MAG TPA: polymer-forming cytoskeletal protein [Nevskiaceae bacterium]|nr:polymer-forming cytoskeletal protein [Nevskiaceae bacterium]